MLFLKSQADQCKQTVVIPHLKGIKFWLEIQILWSVLCLSQQRPSQGGRKQHGRTRQNKLVENITNKTQREKKVWERGLKKKETFEKNPIENETQLLPSSETDQLFSPASAKMDVSSPTDSMTHFWAITIYVVLFLNISWKKPGFEWQKKNSL